MLRGARMSEAHAVGSRRWSVSSAVEGKLRQGPSRAALVLEVQLHRVDLVRVRSSSQPASQLQGAWPWRIRSIFASSSASPPSRLRERQCVSWTQSPRLDGAHPHKRTFFRLPLCQLSLISLCADDPRIPAPRKPRHWDSLPAHSRRCWRGLATDQSETHDTARPCRVECGEEKESAPWG